MRRASNTNDFAQTISYNHVKGSRLRGILVLMHCLLTAYSLVPLLHDWVVLGGLSSTHEVVQATYEALQNLVNILSWIQSTSFASKKNHTHNH